MSYLVLARRWRPKKFADLVGQDVVVRTLKNALKGESLAHAYLLTGIRGVGKTTIARLLAMAINCKSPVDGEPCGECAACTGITSGSNLDVQEMDAASHTGVDDIREILDGVRYPPSNLKYKVYIIDEAHMLSKSAFNALLKTLEEPPARVMFILATTEAEKLPVTVRSRCQRFDLRRLGMDEIAAYLQSVLKQEEIGFEEDAVQEIARSADGSVRDALSLCERVLAFSGKSIAVGDVYHSLGMVGPGLIQEISDHIFSGDAAAAVKALREAANGGHAPRSVLSSLSELWHELMCLKVDAGLIEYEHSNEKREWLEYWASRWDVQGLDLRYQVLIAGLRDLGLMDERRGAEMLLIRLSHLNALQGPSETSAGKPPGRAEKPTTASAPAANKSAATSPSTVAKTVTADVQASPSDDDEELLDEQPFGASSYSEAEDDPYASDDDIDEADVQPEEGVDLPLHPPATTVSKYPDWESAVTAYSEIRPGIAAMLGHVVCLSYGDKVKLALDAHQERALAVPERLAFAEWLGREVHWEQRQENEGESLTEARERMASAEQKRLWEEAESDPHVQAVVRELGAKLVHVSPHGAKQANGTD